MWGTCVCVKLGGGGGGGGGGTIGVCVSPCSNFVQSQTCSLPPKHTIRNLHSF